jgi:alkyl hydroperoxide reductase subunit AhpC
LAGTK